MFICACICMNIHKCVHMSLYVSIFTLMVHQRLTWPMASSGPWRPAASIMPNRFLFGTLGVEEEEDTAPVTSSQLACFSSSTPSPNPNHPPSVCLSPWPGIHPNPYIWLNLNPTWFERPVLFQNLLNLCWESVSVEKCGLCTPTSVVLISRNCSVPKWRGRGHSKGWGG